MKLSNGSAQDDKINFSSPCTVPRVYFILLFSAPLRFTEATTLPREERDRIRWNAKNETADARYNGAQSRSDFGFVRGEDIRGGADGAGEMTHVDGRCIKDERRKRERVCVPYLVWLQGVRDGPWCY